MLLKTYECRRINVEQTLTSRENKNVWEKLPPYISCTIPAAPPLVAGATTFPPAELGALWVLGISGNRCLWQQRRETINRAEGPVCLFSPPARAVVKVLSKLAPQAPTFIYHLQFTIYHFHMGAHRNPLNPRGVSRVLNKKYLYPIKDKIE